MNKANDQNTRITQITRSRVKQSFLHFGSLYRLHSLRWQILLSIVMGILFGVVEFTLLQITGIYQMGLGALAQGLARFVRVYNHSEIVFNVLFWMINFLGNVPLFIFAYFKIGKRFAFLNFCYLISSTISGFVCALIPTSSQWFIFSDPNSILKVDGKNILQGVEIVLWNIATLKEFSIFFYAMLFGALQAIFNATLLITGSSTAGFDIIAIYMSKKKFRDMGSVFLLLHLVSLIIANLFGTYIPTGVALSKYPDYQTQAWALQNFFSPTFMAGVLMIIVNGITLNILFPKFKVVKVEVYSSQVESIQEAISQVKERTYATTIVSALGGYSKKTQKILITNCLFIDAAQLLELVRKIDQNAFVSVLDVKKVDGYVYTASTKHSHLLKSKNKANVQNQDNSQI
ncbi:YitT family protein [Mycoplasma simbae]|uniref:YitT family protein n=1 Tax=Mycoplasma simbae TaxID=36744 RepID=UPI000497115F|nr:YitT family protein [Mycoplasma simbae]